MSPALRERVRTAEDIADLFWLAQNRPDEATRQTLLNVVARHSSPPLGVRHAQAAQALQVSLPTIRAWVQRGVLDQIPNSPVREVSAVSLGWALAVVRTASDAGQRHLMATLDSLRDRDLLLRTHDALANTHDEELLAPYTAADLEALREQ
jgi:hypothetical protein